MERHVSEDEIAEDRGEFNEDSDAGFVGMRMIETRQAEETMQRGVSEGDNPSTFLA
jgi:hypothetical protein